MNMKSLKLTSTIIAVLMGIILFGCVYVSTNADSHNDGVKRWGEIKTEQRALSQFNKIAVSSVVDLVITQGDTYEVKVEANEKLLDKIRTEVVDGELTINMDHGRYGSFEAQVYVTLPSLISLKASGASEVVGRGNPRFESEDFDLSLSGATELSKLAINCKHFKAVGSGSTDIESVKVVCDSADVTFSGASDAEMNLICNDTLLIKCSGSSDVEIKGTAQMLSGIFSGSVDVDMNEFRSVNADVTCSGSSNAELNVSENLKTNISGVASLYNNKKAVGR